MDGYQKALSLGAAYSGATKPIAFTANGSWLVTEIISCRWNNGQGKAPGTVGLNRGDN
jgi:hypothetical protein